MIRFAAIVFSVAILAACSDARILDGDANMVWVKENLILSGSPDEVAARHCAQFGKKAVYERTLDLGRDALTPARVYACH
ncbi:MAG: hypothetical protein QGF38_09900 [Rhodospirillales bacterium]|jgi:hypothetical protein|nr:hypothetical protein [Rhodospirillales bacterium]MDP7652000.1 hypothetical protein [Rhodospirillales bacterium]